LEYRGKKYELKKITLGLKAVMTDILLLREDLVYEATKDIDLTGLNKYKMKRDEIEAEIQAYLAEGEDVNIDKINNAKERLAKLEQKYAEDYELQNTIKYYESKANMCLVKLITNEKLVKKVIPEILTEDPKLDMSEPDAERFIGEVFNKFFLSIR